MDDIERALSVRLNDVMEKIGASEKIRKLYQHTAITEEIIDTIKIVNTTVCQMDSVAISSYIFGSSSEGTTTLKMKSDVDRVICIDTFPVIDDINTAAQGISLLMVRDDHTYPGYVKLQVVSDGIPLTIFDTELPDNNYYDTDSTGRICYKHWSSNLPNEKRHGPADTTPEQYGRISTDKVIAFRCKKIPYFVTEWLYRGRSNLWPTRANLQTLSGLGCFVVGVGHCTSRDFNIEWRLSFSLQERLLMFSFNPTQHRCYIILKLLKKEIIENTKSNMWKPHKLLTCARVCLMLLLMWVYSGYCPNYFVPSENMFERPRHREIKGDLVQVLRELVSELPSFILHLQCDCLGQMITDETIYSQNITTVQYVKYLENFSIAICFSDSINTFCNANGDQRYACLQLSNIIKRLMNIRRITEHTGKQTIDAISYVIPFLHLHFAQRLVSLAFTTDGQPCWRNILQLSIQHFHKRQSTDLLTSKLLIVTLLMRLQYYKLCEEILEGVSDSLRSHVISKCGCFNKPCVPNDKLMKLIKDETISIKTFCELCVVACVKFLPCDTEITPIPLRAELFRPEGTIPGSRDDESDHWFDWAVVDGKVYLYFLQYLVYSKLGKHANKRVAIENLIWVLGDDPNIAHKETAYNLIGWIHVQEGRPQDAILYFMASWIIRPHHNAAKFHIRKLAHDMMQL